MRLMRTLAMYPADGSHLSETTIYGDYVRYLVEKSGKRIDFDVGTRRVSLRDNQLFWEGRIPLDFEVKS